MTRKTGCLCPPVSMLSTRIVFVCQVASPAGQLVSSLPLEPTPAEEESRKSVSRSFKGTMASSAERRLKQRCRKCMPFAHGFIP